MSDNGLDRLAKAWTLQKTFFISVAVGSIIALSACTVAAVKKDPATAMEICIYVSIWSFLVFHRFQFHCVSSDDKQALFSCISPQLSSCHLILGGFTPTMCHHIFNLSLTALVLTSSSSKESAYFSSLQWCATYLFTHQNVLLHMFGELQVPILNPVQNWKFSLYLLSQMSKESRKTKKTLPTQPCLKWVQASHQISGL